MTACGKSLSNMKYSNEKSVYIQDDIMLDIERANYIYKSYSAFISILAKEFANNKSKETSDLLEKYRTNYQNAYIRFNVYINAIIENEFHRMITDIHYDIDFIERKIVFKWN